MMVDLKYGVTRFKDVEIKHNYSRRCSHQLHNNRDIEADRESFAHNKNNQKAVLELNQFCAKLKTK